MTAELILEFDGVTVDQYHAVNKVLGIDPVSGAGDPPDGLVAHSAGVNDAGHLVVIEVWDTPEHQGGIHGEPPGSGPRRGRHHRTALGDHVDRTRLAPAPRELTAGQRRWEPVPPSDLPSAW